MPEKTYCFVKYMSDSATNTIGLLSHPAWSNVNDCEPLNSLAISHWVQYNRTKMAMRRVTVSDVIRGVRGVIPNSKLAIYGDYSYDIEVEAMYQILEEMTETCSYEKLPIPQLKLDKGDQNRKPSENTEQRYTDDINQWISKWQKLLSLARRVINEEKPIDRWTETFLKTCLWFFSVLKCNPSLMQVMNTEMPFVTDFRKVHNNPTSMAELMSFPQPVINDNLNVDAAEEDSLWLKLSSPSIRKLWENDKSDKTTYPSDTNFLRRHKNRNVKVASEEAHIFETEAKDLLGSLLEVMDEHVDHGERKTSQVSVKMESQRDREGTPTSNQERYQESAVKMPYFPCPIVPPPPRHMYPPPPLPFLYHNTWSWNRYPPKVIPTPTAFKNLQFILHKMNAETTIATAQHFERKNDVQKNIKTSDYLKSYVSNVQLYCHSFLPCPSKQEVTQASCSAKRINNLLMQTQNPQILPYPNKQHILKPLNCNRIQVPPQFMMHTLPGPCKQELMQPINNRKTYFNITHSVPQAQLYKGTKQVNKTPVVMPEQTKMKKGQTRKECKNENKTQHHLKSTVEVMQKHVPTMKYNHEFVGSCGWPMFKMSTPPNYQIMQNNQEMLSSQEERKNTSLGFISPKQFLSVSKPAVIQSIKGTNSNLKKNNIAIKLRKRNSRKNVLCIKTSCREGNHKRKQNEPKRKFELQNLLLQYGNLLTENSILKGCILHKSKGIHVFENCREHFQSKMKEKSSKENKWNPNITEKDVFTSFMELSKFSRKYLALEERQTPNDIEFFYKICKTVRKQKCFKQGIKESIMNLNKIKNHSIKSNLNKPSPSTHCCLDENSSQELKKRLRISNPLHSHFEIKSWSDKKVENQIRANYFHLIADSLLLDNLFKVNTEYGVINLIRLNGESITGWMHLKMALQEVFRNTANHLLNDTWAPVQSKKEFNSFLIHVRK